MYSEWSGKAADFYSFVRQAQLYYHIHRIPKTKLPFDNSKHFNDQGPRFEWSKKPQYTPSSYRLRDEDSIVTFGQHHGRRVIDVMNYYPGYIEWARSLGPEAYGQAKQLVEIADKVWRRAELKVKFKAAFRAVLTTQRLWRLLELKSRENFAEDRDNAVRAAVADMRAFLDGKQGLSPVKRKRCAESPVSDAGSSTTRFGSPPATKNARRREPPENKPESYCGARKSLRAAWRAKRARDDRYVRRLLGLE